MARAQAKAALAAIALCVGLTVASWSYAEILGVRLALPEGRHVLIWPEPWKSLLLFLAALPLSAAAMVLARRVPPDTPLGRAVHVLIPLSVLPLTLYAPLLRRILPQPLAADVLFFVPVAAAAVCLVRWVGLAEARSAARLLAPRDSIAACVAATLLFTATGVYFTQSVGPHSGDENHYIIQVESLWHDHDLDIRNNLGNPAETLRGFNHISPRSRGGHWYSWHSFGLPLLLAPVAPLGVVGRHIVLALLSGLACAGILELCRWYGAQRNHAWLVLGLFALGCYWGIYSSRCLPEVGGAALVVWSVLACLRADTWRRGSLAIAVVSLGFMLWMHTRFIPLSLAIAACYGLAVLVDRGDSPPRRYFRATLFGLLYTSALAAFAGVQWSMFTGALPSHADDVLFTKPSGMWHILASDRSILVALPMFAWMMAAAIRAAGDRLLRAGAAAALLLLVIVLGTCATSEWYAGGACVPGRYLLVVTPLLLPFAVEMFRRAASAARFWLIFLGLVSLALFVLELARLPEYSKSFTNPPAATAFVYAVMDGLAKPLAPAGDTLAHPVAILFYGGTFCLLLSGVRAGLQWLMVAAMMAGAALSAYREHAPHYDADRGLNQTRLADIAWDLDKAWILSWGDRAPVSILDVSDRFSRLKPPNVTTGDPGLCAPGTVVSQARVGINDWQGRGYRWVTLVRPFHAGPGPYVCRLRGQVEGTSRVVWAGREGSRTLYESSLSTSAGGAAEDVRVFRCEGNGLFHILVRLEGGEGMLRNVSVSWSPFSMTLQKGAGLTLN